MSGNAAHECNNCDMHTNECNNYTIYHIPYTIYHIPYDRVFTFCTTSEKKFPAKETLATEPERESKGELCAEI